MNAGEAWRWARGLGLVALGILVGAAVRTGCSPAPAERAAEPSVVRVGAEQDAPSVWTCSMHPSVRSPSAGRCPICGMALVPVAGAAGREAGNPRRLTVSEDAVALMEVQTSRVERRFVTGQVRLVGKIAFDETRRRVISAWVPGRLDRLYVDFTGTRVRPGDHLVEIYSPELLAAQEELLQTVALGQAMQRSDMEVMRRTASETVVAARERLRLWGLTPGQIAEIEARGEPSDHITVYSPAGGVVVDKNVSEGAYVQPGTPLYTIADLSQVWAMLDAYESDLTWLRYGQRVDITTEAYPGETFTGWVAFIAPVVDEHTRTVKVRVDVPNADEKLKPDMFVRATVQSTVAAGGRVMAPDLAGKWICPMHPGVVHDAAGACDICGMPLVAAESLGYVPVREAAAAMPLVIPASAPLITGKRAVVYVRLPDRATPTFEGREVVLGPRAGDYYIVREGLAEGELVVTQGNFKIDSALQIQAKPSMMGPGNGHRGHASPMPASPEPAHSGHGMHGGMHGHE